MSSEQADKLITTKIQLSIRGADVLILFISFKFLVTTLSYFWRKDTTFFSLIPNNFLNFV